MVKAISRARNQYMDDNFQEGKMDRIMLHEMIRFYSMGKSFIKIATL